MPLPDRSRSRVVLIGTSSYHDDLLPDLPSVSNNLADLKGVLTDPDTGVFDAEHCTIVENPADPRVVAKLLADVAAEAEDVLLVYYAGHGVIGARRHELFLGVTGTELDRPHYSALPFGWVRDELEDSRAATRVLILDCCFSGLAIDDFMADQESLVLGQVEVSGTYTLTSTSATSTALAPLGARHTAFSGALLALLRTGVPGGPAELDLRLLYQHLHRRMAAKGWPTPKQRGTDNAHDLALGRNPAYRVADRPAEANRAAGTVHPVAAAPRTTDVFGHATNQLGSDKLVVRTAGLYALEHLAQDVPARRQAVVNVICGYLRMPFRTDDDVAQEREVRITAQRILEKHLYRGRHDHEKPASAFWDDIDVDLTSAYLIDTCLANCRIKNAVFDDVVFSGTTEFSRTRIAYARFDGTRFDGSADFSSSKLHRCSFHRATFGGDATFTGAELDDPDFADSVFRQKAMFWQTSFRWGAAFHRAEFHGPAEFGCAQFGTPQGSESEPIDTSFAHAFFAISANFTKAWFIHGVDAVDAEFPVGAWPPEFGPPDVQQHIRKYGRGRSEPTRSRRPAHPV